MLGIRTWQKIVCVVLFSLLALIVFRFVSAMAPTITQNYYRWYADTEDLTPSDEWPDGAIDLGENAAITASDRPPTNGEPLRLRMSLQIGANTLPQGIARFRLQYGRRITTCNAITNWADIGDINSGDTWRAVDGAEADGTNLSTNPPAAGDLLLSVSDVAATYEEESPTANNPFEVAVGEDVELDWYIEPNDVVAERTYCFRMIKINGGAMDTYQFYPTVTASGYRPESRNWRFYNDETNETPTVALAPENTAPINIDFEDIVKLRVTVDETASIADDDIKFKLQYSTSSDFSTATDVVEISSCEADSVWCYADGVDADDDAISTNLLTDATAKGVHNESGTSTSTFDPAADTPTEFEFTIEHAGALPNTIYFFRLFDTTNNIPVYTASGESYPSISTQGGTLSFAISGLASGTVTEGVTTDAATTATSVSFGDVSLDTEHESAQQLQVTTNAPNGYTVFMFHRQGLLSETLDEILGVTGTNATPSAWSSGCLSSAAGCYGYHTGDDLLSGSSTRFASNDTYAAPHTDAKEIAFSSVPVNNDTIDVVFKTEVSVHQSPGTYQGAVVYIAVPEF